MKILIISDAWHPQINGVVRTYEHLSHELENLGHQVKVIGPSDFHMRMPLPGYAEIKLAFLPYKRLKKYIEDFVPDHIHLSTEGPLGWAGRRYCVENDLTFSSAYHTHFPDYLAKRIGKILPFMYKRTHEWAKNWIRSFHEQSSAMMVATKSLEDELREWGFKTPIQRLTRGVKIDQFFPKTNTEETPYKDLKHPIALYVGRVAIEKNIEDFLKMPWDGTKVIVGDGPSKNDLMQKYPDAVFTGSKEGADLGAHYRHADIFIFPSKTDTFGMVIIEALASGLPVAAYNVTGPKDIITNKKLGALTDGNLGDAAKEALKYGTPEERSDLVKSTYIWEKVGKQFELAILNKAT